MKEVLKVAIIGIGSRGADCYGQMMHKDPRFTITAICDIRKHKVDRFRVEFNVEPSKCFLNEEEFFKEKHGDVCVIATQDRDHVRHCKRALELGYDVLLEKPITPDLNECYELLDAQKKYGGRVIVCHVLRYAPAYIKLDEMLRSGLIGKLINIHAIEQVAYWHQAHSFVRGNWRRKDETSPMIMAKCCHDLDLIQHFARSKFKHVSSIGALNFFKKENQPEGASDRCQTCKYIHTCPYSAYRIYVGRWEEAGCPEVMWPESVVTPVVPLTKEAIIEGYETSNYGQCVFACDNDVVDTQETNILFENGVTANLLMTAFTQGCGRHYMFHGTLGLIDFDELEGTIKIKIFGGKTETISIASLADINGGHGGGDQGIKEDVYKVFALDEPATTTLEESLQSHIIALKAEEDRLKNL